MQDHGKVTAFSLGIRVTAKSPPRHLQFELSRGVVKHKGLLELNIRFRLTLSLPGGL